MGHTKEPWEQGIGDDTLEIFAIDNNRLDVGRRVRVATCNSKFLDKIPNETNAERIVTCVNAMEGLSNDEVKRYGPEVREMVRVITQDMFAGRSYTIHSRPPVWYISSDKAQDRIYALRSRIEGKESG